MRAWVQPFRKNKRDKLGGLGVGDWHALQPDRVIAC